VTLSLAERVQGAVASGVGRLPASVLRLLSGGTPVRIDGQELDAEVQFALAMLKIAGHRNLDTMTPDEARADIRRNARIFAGTPLPMARIEALTLPGPVDAIPAQLYVPRADGRTRPLVVFYHGGGWVVGGLDTHDGVCRFLAREADVLVLAVDYRLAPEHRFPAAVDDACAAFAWAVREAGALCSDPSRIAVAGDSAGGNLAAVVSQLAVASGGPRPAAQLLVYPATDLSTKRRSFQLFSSGFFLTEADVDWYKRQYIDEAAWRDVRASPLLREDLRGHPPAIVATAGFDVLRDEGEAYAARLREAGVQVELHRVTGQIHGFANATGVSPSARAAMGRVAALVRTMLAS
jgi:acetyl esterase